MSITLLDAIKNVRYLLAEEAGPSFYTDTMLTSWLNAGLRDLARRNEILFTVDQTIQIPAFNPSLANPGPPQYALLNDTVRIYRVEFVPVAQTNQIYRVEPSTQNEMDQIWGTYQQNTSTYPRWYVLLGYPGGSGRSTFLIQLYPAASQPGTLNVYYYRQPTKIEDPVANPAALNTTLDVVEGWDDIVVDYAVYKALQRARDPEWQNRKAEYEEKVAQQVDVTRRFHDQQSYISYGTNMLPAWLVGGGEW